MLLSALLASPVEEEESEQGQSDEDHGAGDGSADFGAEMAS